MWLSLLVLPTLAAETGLRQGRPQPLLGHPVLDLRVGVAAAPGTGAGPAVVCAQVSPLARVGLEACGNGSGWWHSEDVPDLAHFRARAVVAEGARGPLEGGVIAAAGFVELQSGPDAPGFKFGEPTERNPVEAAGPELAVGAQGRWWAHERAYVTADLTVGAAHVPGAPAVAGTRGPAVVFGALTVGAGF